MNNGNYTLITWATLLLGASDTAHAGIQILMQVSNGIWTCLWYQITPQITLVHIVKNRGIYNRSQNYYDEIVSIACWKNWLYINYVRFRLKDYLWTWWFIFCFSVLKKISNLEAGVTYRSGRKWNVNCWNIFLYILYVYGLT